MNPTIRIFLKLGVTLLLSFKSHAQTEFSMFLGVEGYSTKIQNSQKITYGVSEGLGVDFNYKKIHIQLSSSLMSEFIDYDETISQDSKCYLYRERYNGRLDQLQSKLSFGYNFLSQEKSRLILFLSLDMINVLNIEDKESFTETHHNEKPCNDFKEENLYFYEYQKQNLVAINSRFIFTPSIHLEYRYIFNNFYLSGTFGINPFKKNKFSETIYGVLSKRPFTATFFAGIRLGYTINHE